MFGWKSEKRAQGDLLTLPVIQREPSLEAKLRAEIRICPTCAYEIVNPMNERCPRCFTTIPSSEHTNCGECSHQGNCEYTGEGS